MHELESIQEAVRFIHARISAVPTCGLVLGTGMSSFADQLSERQEIPYRLIPHFVESTVVGHAGKLVFGKLNGLSLVIMAGRYHYYEGYSLQEVTFPIRVMKYLGIERLIITNIAGGLQPRLKAGDLLIIEDHINLIPSNPLRGIYDARLGTRFPDLTNAYDIAINRMASEWLDKQLIRYHKGVYVAVAGPSLETKAERLYLQKIGGDAVGVSTVPEVIVCKQMRIPVNAFSIISNELSAETSVEEVNQIAKETAPRLSQLLHFLLAEIALLDSQGK
jgi:purine-nucleoside phosphorylase